MVGAMVGILGGLLGAGSQWSGGQAESRAASYNAGILDQQALLSEQAMETETRQMRDRKRRMIGSQEAGFAKSGAMLTEGTPLLVLAEQAGEMEKDILQQRRNRMIEQQRFRSEAAMTRYGGKQARRAANIGAVSTLLGAGAQGASLMNFGGGKGPTSPVRSNLMRNT